MEKKAVSSIKFNAESQLLRAIQNLGIGVVIAFFPTFSIAHRVYVFFFISP